MIRKILFGSSLLLATPSAAQNAAMTFNQSRQDASIVAQSHFSTEKVQRDALIEFFDPVIGSRGYCIDYGFKAYIFQCSMTIPSSVHGYTRYNVSTTSNAEKDWMTYNCPSGEYISSGDVHLDNCAQINY